jgi:hypothetical protein
MSSLHSRVWTQARPPSSIDALVAQVGMLGIAVVLAVANIERPTWGLFHIGFAICGGFLTAWNRRVHGGDILHPVVFLTLLMYLYATGSAAYVLNDGCTYHDVMIEDYVLSEFYKCCVLGAGSLFAGAFLAHAAFSRQLATPDPRKSNSVLSDIECRRRLIRYGLLFSIPVFSTVIGYFMPLGVKSYAETQFASRIDALDNPVAVITGVLIAIPVQWLFTGWFLTALKEKSPFVRIAGAIPVILYLVVAIMTGRKGMVIMPVLICTCVYHYSVKRIPARVFLCVVAFGHLFVTAMSIARHSSDPRAMMALVQEDISRKGIAEVFSLRNSGELLVAQNLMVLMKCIESGQTTFNCGDYVISEVLVMIPRALYPDRPLAVSQEFADLITAGATQSGMGYGFFVLQEGYWVYGNVGVSLMMLACGWFIEWVYLRFQGRANDDLAIVVYGGFLSVCAESVRAGVVLQAKTGLLLVIPFLVARYLPSPSLAGMHNNRVREMPA